jgi:hypothetical protein
VLADVGVTTNTDVVRFVFGVEVSAGVADAGRKDLAIIRRITSRICLFGPVRAANIASIIHPVSADVESRDHTDGSTVSRICLSGPVQLSESDR